MWMYCLTHEGWINPELMDYVPEECLFTMSEPPELPDNWIEMVTEPSAEEMQKMELNADELLMDLVGAGL